MRRKNLDRCEEAHATIEAELALRDERISSQKAIDREHWLAHDGVHQELARSLIEYKRESNEWRATVSDLRGTFQTKAEYQAKHDGLRAELLAEVKPTESALAALKEWQLQRDARERGVTSTLTAQRAIVLIVGSILGTILTVASLATLIASIAKP